MRIKKHAVCILKPDATQAILLKPWRGSWARTVRLQRANRGSTWQQTALLAFIAIFNIPIDKNAAIQTITYVLMAVSMLLTAAVCFITVALHVGAQRESKSDEVRDTDDVKNTNMIYVHDSPQPAWRMTSLRSKDSHTERLIGGKRGEEEGKDGRFIYASRPESAPLPLQITVGTSAV